MGLREQQSQFVKAIAKLIQFATQYGYELTLGDGYRDPRVEWTYGARNSKHKKRLAVDFNLFKQGRYLQSTEHHALLGNYWKKLGGIWGGDFKKNPDGNHYEWPEV